jgi:hypothetical protein
VADLVLRQVPLKWLRRPELLESVNCAKRRCHPFTYPTRDPVIERVRRRGRELDYSHSRFYGLAACDRIEPGVFHTSVDPCGMLLSGN